MNLCNWHSLSPYIQEAIGENDYIPYIASTSFQFRCALLERYNEFKIEGHAEYEIKVLQLNRFHEIFRFSFSIL